MVCEVCEVHYSCWVEIQYGGSTVPAGGLGGSGVDPFCPGLMFSGLFLGLFCVFLPTF